MVPADSCVTTSHLQKLRLGSKTVLRARHDTSSVCGVHVPSSAGYWMSYSTDNVKHDIVIADNMYATSNTAFFRFRSSDRWLVSSGNPDPKSSSCPPNSRWTVARMGLVKQLPSNVSRKLNRLMYLWC